MKKAKNAKRNKGLKVNSKKSEKIIILENKKRLEEIKQEESQKNIPENEELEDEIAEVSSGFKLGNVAKSRNIESIPIGTSLEGGLAFAPRIRDRTKEGKIYSEKPVDYDPKYNAANYDIKTPNLYGEAPPAQQSGESKESKEKSNQ